MLGTVAYSWKPERRARKWNLHGLYFASKRCEANDTSHCLIENIFWSRSEPK